MRPFLTPAHGIACVTLALGIAMTPSTAFAQHAEHQSAGIGIPAAMKADFRTNMWGNLLTESVLRRE